MHSSWLARTAHDMGSRDGSVVQRRVHDRKVKGLISGRGGGRIFFSMVNFLQGQLSVLTLISESVPPPCCRSSTHVTDPNHSAQSAVGRLQLNTHAPYVYDIVNRCMVVWFTQNVHRDGTSLMWHQRCNNQTAL